MELKSKYYDAVLDEEMNPLANGTREEILAWIELTKHDTTKFQICDGRTLELMSVQNYVDKKY